MRGVEAGPSDFDAEALRDGPRRPLLDLTPLPLLPEPTLDFALTIWIAFVSHDDGGLSCKLVAASPFSMAVVDGVLSMHFDTIADHEIC